MKISDYGAALRQNKQALAGATAHLPHDQRCLLTAMAMLETNTMSIGERDAGKDHLTNGAANVSIFNLNVDMVRRLGFTGSPGHLNRPEALRAVVDLLTAAFKQWGTERTLAFVRGGYTAFQDGHSYGAKEYIATIYRIRDAVRADAALLTDGRRVEVYLQHV